MLCETSRNGLEALEIGQVKLGIGRGKEDVSGKMCLKTQAWYWVKDIVLCKDFVEWTSLETSSLVCIIPSAACGKPLII